MPTLSSIRKALVPIVAEAILFAASKLGVDIPADTVTAVATALVTSGLIYATKNK